MFILQRSQHMQLNIHSYSHGCILNLLAMHVALFGVACMFVAPTHVH